ncbi:glycine--tRNA ligase subunit beta [Oceanobacillus kimchii]|uniref:glycine--tRNA ligase subunit beta n=1 Tax=Oceanobacillus kimchii TaxID=746691 RepID=UPI0003461184|nr:glycine--tRNA ligase subunit beta [Oceanobacillus kimchii]
MARDVLIEIGLEELPARFIDDAELQLYTKTKKWLEENRVSSDNVESYSTPRRLAVLVKNMAEKQTSIEEDVKGPALKIAKDEEGNWTKAAQGFTKGQGLSTDDIIVREVKGNSYIYVTKHIEGKSIQELLPEFKSIIESITFGKNMRWGNETIRYARPIRWLVAMYGDEVIPFEIAHVATNNITYGHRFLGEEVTLQQPAEYEKTLKDNYVIAKAIERETLIVDQLSNLEKEHGFEIPVDQELLEEVRNLVEYPTAFVGKFEEAYLEIPSEVLITSMKEHQRYFPVHKNGKLQPYFIGVRNGDDYHIETVSRGNEKVLRARLADAEFFYNEDRKQSIDFFQEKLTKVVFQEKLGTYSEKVKRMKQIADRISEKLSLAVDDRKKIERTAEISKFDLMTNMVNEFTELQGIIGEKYANHFGEDKATSQAIKEHYQPKHAKDDLPQSVIGSVVSVADKLDTIAGCIAVGLIPTGSQDPYGLRRQAAGILRILHNEKWNLTVEELIDIALEVFQASSVTISEKTTKELIEFFRLRTVYLMKDAGLEVDVIHAVTDQKIGNIFVSFDKAQELSGKRNDESFKPIQEALVRVLNLSNKVETNESISEEKLETESEKKLYARYLDVKEVYQNQLMHNETKLALATLAQLAAPIHSFFDNNMVMADDIKIRNNRLALIQALASLILPYADLRKIEWKQQF